MLNLSRPLNSIDGLTLFVDHEQPNLVYFLPDEIRLSQAATGAPDLSLQIYFPEEAVGGDLADLGSAVGSLLSLGVHCGLSLEREQKVRAALTAQLGREDIHLTPPPWEDGTVDLLLLDVTSGENLTAAMLTDRLVSGVVGTRRPSLDGQLSALFHARLDRRGTALAVAALQGKVGTIAGILYDLKFAALRPTVDMRLRADLNRVADYIRSSLGVQTQYVAADISAAFSQMKEAGEIDVDITSQVADPEAERMVNEAVKDFYDVLMRELFRPTVSPAEALGAAAGLGGVSTSLVKLAFTYTRTEHERKVEVDYRKRSATTRTHNPQSHLHDLASLVGGSEGLIQRVPLSLGWREATVEVDAPAAFDDENLQQIRVVLWRGNDKVLPPEQGHDGGLLMPADVTPLADFAFTRNDNAPRHLAWVAQPDEPPSYHWQARMTYRNNDAIVSPATIWSQAHTSTSQDLDLFPTILAPEHRVVLKYGAGHDADLASITAHIVARSPDNQELATKQLFVNRDQTEASWAIRRGEAESALLTSCLAFHYAEGRVLTLGPTALLDCDLVANDPFSKRISLSPLVANVPDDLLAVYLVANYRDEETQYEHQEKVTMRPPDFASKDLTIPVLRYRDHITWEASAVNQAGKSYTIGKGESEGGVLPIMVSRDRRIQVEWVGAAPADLGLRWVRTTLQARLDSGEVVDSKSLEWRGATVLTSQIVMLSSEGTAEWAVERRFENGERQSETFRPLEGDMIVVSG